MKRMTIGLAAGLLVQAAAAAQDWADLGGSASGLGITGRDIGITAPVIAVDQQQRICVAWEEAGEILFCRWNGTTWEGLVDASGQDSAAGAGVSKTAGASSQPSLALDPQDRPILAWQEQVPVLGEAYDKIYVRVWNDTNWVAYGASGGAGLGTSLRNSRSPSLAVDGAGNPCVAWDEPNPSKKDILLARWNPGPKTWDYPTTPGMTAGGVSATPGESYAASVAVSATGTIVVAWAETYLAMDHHVYVRTLTNDGWAPMDWDRTTPLAELPELASALRGSDGLPLLRSQEPCLIMDPQGRPIVAWSVGRGDSANDYVGDVYVLQWYNGAWTELAASASGGGASGNTVATWQNAASIVMAPAVTVDGSGLPIVTWRQKSNAANNHTDLYLRRYTGSAWVGVRGSDIGAGISNAPDSTCFVNTPGVAMLAPDHPVVVWQQRILEGINTPKLRLFARRLNGEPELSNLRQLRAGGSTVIGAGETIPETSFSIEVTGTDPENGAISLEVEVREFGVPFEDTYTSRVTGIASRSATTLAVSNLLKGTSYVWQARAIDAQGLASPWRASGALPDLSIAPSTALTAAAIGQRDPATGATLDVGARFYGEGRVEVEARVNGTGFVPTAVELAVIPVGQSFDGRATASAAAQAGVPMSIVLPVEAGSYRWGARAFHPTEGRSAWVSFGGNSDADADFTIIDRGGSIAAASPCSAGATESLPTAAILVFIAFALTLQSRTPIRGNTTPRRLARAAGALLFLGSALPLAASASDHEWAKGVPYTTDFDEAIKRATQTGKMLFIYNGWEGGG